MVSKHFNIEDNVLDCEVMIVGGGPAGISTWLHLQKYAPQLAGRAVVIEKAVFPRDKLCAGGVGAWSADVLKHLEVEIDIPSLFVSDVEFRFGKEGLQGYVWHFPCLKDGAPSIAHGIGDFRIYLDKPRVDMKKIFSRELQSRNIHPEPKSWSSHPIRWFSNEDLVSQPNVLLVGDAAGIEPAFGGGIHLALSYGEVAAQAVIEAFQSNAFSFHDYKQTLQSHLVGKSIYDCTRLALEMYGGRMNPLHVARELFPVRHGPPNLVSLMLSEVSKILRTS